LTKGIRTGVLPGAAEDTGSEERWCSGVLPGAVGDTGSEERPMKPNPTRCTQQEYEEGEKGNAAGTPKETTSVERKMTAAALRARTDRQSRERERRRPEPDSGGGRP